ncbi:MAG: hypothetical protein WC477_06165 [Patescibacteria group bacterium]
MKPGSICGYLEKCICFIMTGCDGKDYPDCSYKRDIIDMEKQAKDKDDKGGKTNAGFQK